MKLFLSLEVDIKKLMVNSLAAMVDQIGDGDEAGLAEVIPEAASHHGSIAIVKG